jgi:hypothetical protein
LTGGSWYHLAGTYDGNKQSLYVNGILCTNKSYSWGTTAYGYIDQSNVVARLGATPDATPANFFAGKMDDVRVYGSGLSSNAVYAAYQIGADSDGDGLSNWQEFFYGTNPLNPDTNGDGISDGLAVALGANPLETLTQVQPITFGFRITTPLKGE